MWEKIKDGAKKGKEKTKSAISKGAVLVGDLNGDGVIDEKDYEIAAKWGKKKAESLGNELCRIGKEASSSDLVKDAAAGAAVGAVIAVPIPVVGPVAGATVGAALGTYKNLTGKSSTKSTPSETPREKDKYAELLKLDDLRKKGVLTEEEFVIEKNKLL